MPRTGLQRIIQRATRRELLRRAIALGGVGLAIGAGGSCAAILAVRGLPTLWPLPENTLPWWGALTLGAGVGLIGGLAGALVNPWSPRKAAIELDQRLGLNDRLSAALEGVGEGEFGALIRAQGEHLALTVEVERAIDLRSAWRGRAWVLAPALVATCIGLGLWLPARPATQASPSASPLSAQTKQASAELVRLAKATAASAPDGATAQTKANLEALERELAKGTGQEQSTRAKVASEVTKTASELASKSEEAIRQADELRHRLAQGASEREASPVVDKLKRGDLSGAAEELRQAASRLPTMTEEDRRKLAGDLKALENALDQSALSQRPSDGSQGGEASPVAEAAPGSEANPGSQPSPDQPTSTPAREAAALDQPRSVSEPTPPSAPTPSDQIRDSAREARESLERDLPPGPAPEPSPAKPSNQAQDLPQAPGEAQATSRKDPSSGNEKDGASKPATPQGNATQSQSGPGENSPRESQDPAGSKNPAGSKPELDTPQPPPGASDKPQGAEPSGDAGKAPGESPEPSAPPKSGEAKGPSEQTTPGASEPGKSQPKPVAPTESTKPQQGPPESSQPTASASDQSRDEQQSGQQPQPGQGPKTPGSPSEKRERGEKSEKSDTPAPGQSSSGQGSPQPTTQPQSNPAGKSSPEPQGSPAPSPSAQPRAQPGTKPSQAGREGQTGQTPQPGESEKGPQSSPSGEAGGSQESPNAQESAAQSLERLAKQLSSQAQQRERAAQGARDAKKLEKQAEELLRGMTPEQREQLEEMAKHAVQDGPASGQPANSSKPDASGQSSPGGGPENSGTAKGRQRHPGQGEGPGGPTAGAGPRGPIMEPQAPGELGTGGPVVRPSGDLSAGERPVAPWMSDPSAPPNREVAAQATTKTVREAAAGVERAIEQQAVPSAYADVVRRVFARYVQRAGPQASPPVPAQDAPRPAQAPPGGR